MLALPARCAAAADASAEPRDRLPHAVACCLLYGAVSNLLWAVAPALHRYTAACGDTGGWAAVHELCRPFLARDFLAAVAQTALGAVSHGLCMMQPAMRAAVREAPRSCCPPDVLSSWGDGTATSSGRFPSCGVRFGWLAITLAMTHPNAVGPTGPGVELQLPPPVSSVLSALAESRLLPTVAEAILRCPGPACNMVESSALLCGGVSDAVVLLSGLYDFAASDAAAVRTALARQLDDPVVQAYHVAQLDRLAVHGGLEPEGAAAATQAGGAGGGGGPADGTWWLTRFEAQSGSVASGVQYVIANQLSDEKRASLEEPHAHAVFASLGRWRLSEDGRDLRAPPPGPGVPTPERLAQLAARAAEALCRLYRGQGLGGAYRGSPTWQLARSPAITRLLLPCPEDVTPSSLLYWLESAAWSLALCAEAVAAELEGSGGGPAQATWGLLGRYVKAGGPAVGLRQAVTSLAWLVGTGTVEGGTGTGTGLLSLGPAERADALSRLRRAGLAGSLDHALRLAFTATSRHPSSALGPVHTTTTTELLACMGSVFELCRRLPLALLPPATAAARPQVPESPPYGGDGSGALVTLSKRAATLASWMDPWAEREGPEARDAEQACLRQAVAIMPGLREGVIRLRKELTSALGVPGPTATSASPPPAAGDAAASPSPEGASAEGAAATTPTTAASSSAAAAGAVTPSAASRGATSPAPREATAWALELFAYAYSSCCRLATAIAITAAAAAAVTAAAAAPATELLSSGDNAARTVTPEAMAPAACVPAVCDGLTALLYAAAASQSTLSVRQVTAGHLLACQPHRLLAAACRLLCVWSPGEQPRGAGLLASSSLLALLYLASVPELSRRVGAWLTPAAAAATGAAAAAAEGSGVAKPEEEERGEQAEGQEEEQGEEQGENEDQEDEADKEADEQASEEVAAAERGCLERLLRARVIPLLVTRQPPAWAAGGLLALLHQAARRGSGPQGTKGGGGGAHGEQGRSTPAPAPGQPFVGGPPDDDLVAVAGSLLGWAAAGGASEPPVLPDGTRVQALIDDFVAQQAQTEGGGEEALKAPAAEPLPPPLAVPTAALVRRRLRVCGYPGCTSFGGRCEADLPLKLCGGCRAVRYCAGGGCQSAHWMAAHRYECRALAAARVAAREVEEPG
ncbi:hypothetical protein HYH03_004545 [Edaphochlamys debaryana]|nr:hypothetical protein HYH03_004545 [Edaphochlamys debaryana]|eukprot:KAG2497389.1 hypothetical protein HYH03_004545 [Edaphochlamys debaryana]